MILKKVKYNEYNHITRSFRNDLQILKVKTCGYPQLHMSLIKEHFLCFVWVMNKLL